MTIFAPATRRGLFVDWAFFDGSEISSEFVGGQCASWRLPPKAAMPEHGAGVVEAKRNGGLDLLKTAVSVSDTGKRTKSSARQRFFSFPRCGGRCFLIDLPQA